MVTVGLLVDLKAKPGKEEELAELLAGALPLAAEEPETTAWFAVRRDAGSFAIFDVFPTDSGREAHLAGAVAAALGEHASELLSAPPEITRLDVVAATV